MKRCLSLILCILSLWWAAGAAPLQPGDHQAQDAVALLREWGLLEGYPRGGFRGDRAISRFEAAELLSRVLLSLEKKQSGFLNKDQLVKLQTLEQAFVSELEALGLRTDSLENDLESLQKRVDEIERISFGGSFVTRYVAQSFNNQGPSFSAANGGVNYDSLVGSLAGANFLPHGPLGILPVIDFAQGRPLVNGTGLSSTLFLDVNFAEEDWDADLRLFAHSSQGNPLIDATWGTSAPYLASPFTGTVNLNDPQGRNRAPFTTAGFESFEFRHENGLTLTLGRFEPELLNPTVFLTPVNPGINGPSVLGGFGFRGLMDWESFSIEIFGTKLPDGSPGRGGPEYDTNAFGASAQYSTENLSLTANFLRTANESSQGLPLVVGQIGSFNGDTGQLYANWVNPPEFFVANLGGVGNSAVAGANSTSDKRPVPGLTDSDGFSSLATIGPQAQTTAGLSLNWQPHERWTLLGDFAFSQYRPNKNSSYTANDNLWRIGVETALFDEALELSLDYRHTGARFDPFVLSFPTTVTQTAVFRAYHRLPSFDQFWQLYSLHNSAEFPHNRRGLWLDASWRYDPDGVLSFRYRNLSQVKTSLQDVRFTPGSLGAGSPNANVLGFSPGFLDVVFREYSPLSFDANLQPLENRRGEVTSFGFDLNHVFTGSPWRVDLNYDRWHFDRPTSLPANLGGSQNLVDLKTSVGSLSVGRSLGDDVLVTLGYQRAEMKGHYDPAGIYNNFAIANNTVDFKNRDTVQHIPFVTLNWQIAPNMSLESGFRHYFTHDRSVSPAEAFSWEGNQLTTSLSLSF